MDLTPQIVAATQRLLALSDEDFAQFVSALEKAVVSTSLAKVATDVARKLPHLPLDDVHDFAELAVLLYSAVERREFEGADISRRFAELFATASHTVDPYNQEAIRPIAARLRRLSSASGPLNLIAKADDVWRELPRRLARVRILTDVRPIFADGPSLMAASSLVVHTLTLDYHEADTTRQFHVSLDTKGLMMLEKALERARAKEDQLDSLLSATTLSTSKRHTRG